MHAIYMFARSRDLHLVARGDDPSDATPDVIYVHSLLLALSNPYGFSPGQLELVIHYLTDHGHHAKLTDVAPVHRMAKAVAIVPVGHDFPPFSANKGGSTNGTKLFLLTFDLAFQLQEQLQAMEVGGNPPDGFRRDAALARAQSGAATTVVAAMGASTGAAIQPAAVAWTHHRVGRIHERVARQSLRRSAADWWPSRSFTAYVVPDIESNAGWLRSCGRSRRRRRRYGSAI